MKTYKHLFFDLDNTLWDFRANSREAFYEVFSRLGLFERIPDFDRFLNVYEHFNELLWTEYRNGKVKKDFMRRERIRLTLHEMDVNDGELTDKVAALYVQTGPQKSNLFEGVHETLQYLQATYRLYILTNGFAEVQVKKIDHAGLNDYFTKLFMAEMVGYQKPDKRFFEYAVKSIHAHKHECLMIGDDPEADIAGAHRAGIDQVYFNLSGKPCSVKPTWEIRTISELKEIL